jgi:hypothetical protein
MSGCGLFAEASFNLSSDSNLPRWYSLPAESSRTNITVHMSYFVKSSGRTATFTITNLKTNKTKKYHGTLRGLEPIYLKQSKTGRPSYEVITVDGITEVIEHRKMEPIFYIVDNPAILKELGVKSANKSSNPTVLYAAPLRSALYKTAG